jgi:Family of unknown function (DUF6152)
VRRELLALAITAGLIPGGRAYAHHSVAATYMVDKKITIEGKVMEFMYANPHSFVKVEAPDDKGRMQTWAVEWGGVLQLNRDGVSRDSLKPGDHVIVNGSPGRNPGEHRIRVHKIIRPSDGWRWAGAAASDSQDTDSGY